MSLDASDLMPAQREPTDDKIRPLTRAPSAREIEAAPEQLVRVGDQQMTVTELASRHTEAVRELRALKRRRDRSQRAESRREELRPWQVELLKLQRHLEDHQQRMIVLFEGRDAAGKGGTIRRVTRFMNEKHYRVVALGRPTDDQRSQWYFQRYVGQFPHGGEMVLFDRSWYNRAMVEPVFGFCNEVEYDNFMRGVTGFEKDLVRQGTVLVKLYFSVTKEEQAQRFDRRRGDPLRQWKLSEVDMQAQDRWDDFTERKYWMLRRTSTQAAPWWIVRSGDKQRARVNAIKVILNAVDYQDRSHELDFVPDPAIVVSGAQELALMDADRIRQGRFTG
jgi:polyphosphate kinase 2